jgi:hypothetical protein
MKELETTSHDGQPIDKEFWYNVLLPKLTEQQFKAAWKAANKDQKGIVWWKIGEGKTRIAIAWMFMIARQPRPLIVCSPNAKRQWIDEFLTMGVRGIKVRFISTGKLSTTQTMYLDFERYNCIVVDELWMFKNQSSNRSVMINQITNRLPSIGLSGSLMTAGNVEDIYGQAKAMNLNKKVAKSLTEFRHVYMLEEKNWAGFLKRYPREGAVEAIQRRLVDNVDIYFPKETREIRDINVTVEPSTEQLAIRKQLLKSYSYETTTFKVDVKSAASLLVKLQQVSDGFLRDGENHFIPIKSNKQARLYELCEEFLDSGERLLVWCAFRKTAEELSKILPCKTTTLTGNGKFDVHGWRDGKISATIATVGSGASLNDFQDVKYSIFYSTSFSTISLLQAKGRTNRKSTMHNCCYYYFLSSRLFPDKRIYEMVEANKTREEIALQVSTEVLADWQKEHEV